MIGFPRLLSGAVVLWWAMAVGATAQIVPVQTGLRDLSPQAIGLQPEAPVAARPAQGLGQLLVRDAQAGSEVRLNVARYHVHVVLQPPVALVQIDQSFYNPFGLQQEGTFVFNLPPGASVSRFAMYVAPGELVEGELVERQRAANIYQSIVARQRDPAILEQIGDNLFRMRVFPIPPHDTKRILFDYTIPLESSAKQWRFHLPLFSDLEPIWDFRLGGVIRSAVAPGGAASPSHPAVALDRHSDGTVSFELAAQNYRPQADFLLNFTEQAGPQVSVRNYTAEPTLAAWENRQGAAADPWAGRRAMYFQLSIAPDARPASAGGPAAKAAPPADVLVLADTSVEHAQLPVAEADGPPSAGKAPPERSFPAGVHRSQPAPLGRRLGE